MLRSWEEEQQISKWFSQKQTNKKKDYTLMWKVKGKFFRWIFNNEFVICTILKIL